MKKENSDIQKGETVQAVIITDSYDSKFGPLTTTKPRCLLPLAGRPILSYTLEFLKISGVEECFVYSTSFAQDIKDYLQEWTADQGVNVMKVIPLTNEDCQSLGDAMRDIDAKGVLRHNFILVFGDCIGNVNLSGVMDAHKKRTKEDKNATMTLVYKKAFPGHHMRTLDKEVLIAVNNESRILHHVRPGSSNSFKVPLEVFESDETIDLKFNLLDPGIAICTQAVPPLFADNFDCQTLDEFVKGVIQNDLTDNTLYMHEIGDEAYAARVSDLHCYFAAQHDILHRCLYPIVPEIAPGKTPANLSYHRHNIYKSVNVDLKKGSSLEEDVLVGSKSVIGENAQISKSIIGQNCMIGANVIIHDSVIMDGVVIKDSCKIIGSVIGTNGVVGKNCTVDCKCVLGDGVILSDNVKLKAESWLVSEKPKSGFSDDEDSDDDQDTKFGPKAMIYRDDEEDEEDSDEDEVHHEDRGIEAKWGKVFLGACDDDESSGDEDDSDLELDDAINNIEIDDDARFHVFDNEVFESLLRGAKEGVKVDNLILEVNSSRHAYAVTQSQVIQSVLLSILKIAAENSKDSSNPVKLLGEAKKAIDMFHELLAKYVKSEGAQADCLSSFEALCNSEANFLPISAKVVHVLYESDILSDEAIFRWFKGLSNDSAIKAKVKPFIEWLTEDDEESSEEDED